MKIKTLLAVALVLMVSFICAVSVFAAEGNLWADKPTTEPLYSGYVVNGREGHTGSESECTGTIDSHTPTNIKWEVYEEGSEYTLYFSIDNEGYLAKNPDGKYNGNTVIYSYAFGDNSTPHGYGWGDANGGNKHSWTNAGVSVSKVTKIVIGDGIKELAGGTFVGMNKVKVVEMPASLVKFTNSPFKGCASLTTVYSRGQTPVEGTFNLTNVKTFSIANYAFGCCESVKEYIFASDAVMGLAWAHFLNNKKLEKITLPEGGTKLQPTAFGGCTSLREVTLPASLTEIQYQAFNGCSALEKITFKSNASIAYYSAATTKVEVIASTPEKTNAFQGCTSLTTFVTETGTKAADFASKFGFKVERPAAVTIKSGTFANDAYPNATWTWTLDSHGTLTVSGTGANGNTDLLYNGGYNDLAANSFKQIPWYSSKDTDRGTMDGIKITKVVIEESTGITKLNSYAFGYLQYMEEIVFPSTLTEISTSCFSTAKSLKTIRVHGADDLGEGCWDLRNIKTVKGHAFAGAVAKSKVPEGINIYFSEKLTSVPGATGSWNWFTAFGSGTTPAAEMTARVTFNIYRGTTADSLLKPYVERQQAYKTTGSTEGIDTTTTTNLEIKYLSPYSGTFANAYYKNATWTWELDADGTLYIGGKAADGSTNFYYGGHWQSVAPAEDVKQSQQYIPWKVVKQTGSNNDISSLVTKVVIAEETGITKLGTYAFGYLPNCTEYVIPSTVKEVVTSCFSSNNSLKTISVHGRPDAGEGVFDFRNIETIHSHAFAGVAKADKVTEPIEVWFGEGVVTLPKATDAWNWFYPFSGDNNTSNIPTSNMTVGVVFKVYPGTYADQVLSAYVTKQQSYAASGDNHDVSQIDKTNTTNVSLEYWGIGGNTKKDFTGFTWEFDETSGTLTISGTSSDKVLGYSAEVSWGSDSFVNYPWSDYRTAIKKVVVKEETGITGFKNYALANMPNCEAIVLPKTAVNFADYNIFASNPKLNTIVYGDEEFTEGVFDFRYATNYNSQLFESSASGKTITFKASSSAVSISKWFCANTTVNFEVYNNSPIHNWLKNVEAGTDTRASGFKFTIGTVTVKSVGEDPSVVLSGVAGNGNYSWELDYDTGTLTFTKLKTGWCEFYFSTSDYVFLTWLGSWRDQIKHIVVPEFSKYQDANSLFPFSNLPNLETVKWDTKRMMSTGSTAAGKGVFANCPKLTSFGTSDNFELGVVNLDGFSLESISKNYYSSYMFYGCSSIEKVKIGGATYNTGDKPETIVPLVIGKSMFEGCTSLCEIDLDKATAIMANAFKGCSSLAGDVYYYGDANIGSAFVGCGGVIFRTDSVENAKAIAASLNAAGVTSNEAMVASMIHGGFSVRLANYNGLRSFFSFLGEEVMDGLGYTLVEYGSICGAVENYDKYTQDFGKSTSILTLVGNEFKTPEKIVKTSVYTADGYVGDSSSKKVENEDGTVTFTVTVTKFSSAHYKNDIVMTGYEIWMDANGDYFVLYTEVGNKDYKKTSLYDVTLGMLMDDVIDLGEANGPVYTMLKDSKSYELETGVENVEAFLVDHPSLSGKYVAIYKNLGEGDVKVENPSIPLDMLSSVVSFVFESNIEYDVPDIDAYWAEHINAQLATLPEGKSFIAITDTHYPSNAGKSADLMEYVRKMTGIEKVIHLGDSYHDGATYATARSNLEYAMETKFFDYFGDDGMYAVGNHDSNITKSRNDTDDNANTYNLDLILTDKDIYDLTFKHVEEGGAKNRNVVYDELLLSRIEDAYKAGDIKAYALDNVPAADAAQHNNHFGNISYTADEMYENLVYWAKMHYAYYDHASEICYIVLNTGALSLTDFTTLNRELWKFHPSQFEFLNTILREVAETYSDYDVVVAGHMFYDKSEANNSYNSSLFKMLSAFEAGTSVSFSGSGNNALSGKLFGCTNGATSRTLSYDFAGTGFTGEVICITGHRHIDLDLVSQTKDGQYYTSVSYDSVKDNLSDNAVQLILLNQDNWNEAKSAEEAASQTMTKGTITEHSFTIFTITEDNTLVATRIGAATGDRQKTYKLG